MRNDQIIIEPVLTEKTNSMRESESAAKYTFKVNPRANKIQIMEAVKSLFSVKPVDCKIINVKAKPRQSRTKSGMRSGSTTPWKKAIVTLAAGNKIDIIEGA
ncbi:MAG: 50S ribosomal protein L23 [Spirochaetes bacterium]|nr:MAG: 50S ribosomal protein L23 [Spirochaetota bacterium]